MYAIIIGCLFTSRRLCIYLGFVKEKVCVGQVGVYDRLLRICVLYHICLSLYCMSMILAALALIQSKTKQVSADTSTMETVFNTCNG